MNLADSYLESAKSQFLYYKTIGEKSINQLTEEQAIEVDKYLNSKNNKLDTGSNHTQEYAVRLLNTYKIDLVYPTTCTDVFDFIKSQ